MKKTIFLFVLSLLLIAEGFAQKKITQQGFQFKLPKDWKIVSKDSDPIFHCSKTGLPAEMKMEKIEGSNSDEKTKATIAFLQKYTDLSPSQINQSTSETLVTKNLKAGILNMSVTDESSKRKSVYRLYLCETKKGDNCLVLFTETIESNKSALSRKDEDTIMKSLK